MKRRVTSVQKRSGIRRLRRGPVRTRPRRRSASLLIRLTSPTGPQPGSANSGGAGSSAVQGLRALLEQALIPPEAAAALAAEVESLGAVQVQELRQAD